MSRGSMMDTNDNISYPTAGPKFIGQPSRQPYAPPENSRVQANEGFVRFLKQHASPPHHRVTAGGRIVPAGPTSPPPMLDFGSLNGLVQKRTAAATSSLKQGSSNLPNARPQPIQTQPNQSVPFGGYHSGQVEGMANQSLAQVTPLQAVLPFDNGEYGAQAAVNPLVQSATNMVVTGMFPDGSTMVFLNGMNYRSYWNGANMIMEPFQPFQSSLGQQALMTSCQQFVQYSPLYGPGLQAQPASLSKPLASTTNKSQSYSSNSRGGSQSHHLSSDEFGMKTELSNLDKHLALHHYDIGLGERATMVARRKHLVQEIDKIRVSKEKPKHTIPIIAPATGLPIIQAAQSSSGPRGNQTTPLSVRQEAQKTESTKEGSFSKCLSPAAPPFIPKCMQTAASNKPGVHVVSEQATRHGHSTGMAPPVHKESTSINKRTVSGVPAKEAEAQGRKATWDSGSRVVSHSEESSSGVLDPSDPAMRVIDYEDIEYASRYLYNWDKAKKTYCTTVAEFQEAIRRVREQARMYGCEGGQSKDPAYDAEQDIWWAICDRDPIPLPAEIPDHIANPRPWNWNDSAFNCRTSSNPWGEPASMNARNSPRKLAWDPIMTENQKNKKDVSRSYYALKGQLPSVPFRDFVYDYEGNKIPVEREMAPAPITARARDENEDYSLMVGAQKGFQKASAENVKTVTALSASNHNARQAGSAMASESKADGKENVSGGDLQARLEVHTPKGKRIFSLPASAKDVAHLTTPTSKPRSSEANAAAKATKVASAHKTFQAYVEECPDTPAGPRTRPDEMRFSNPQGQCNTTSIFSNVPPEPVENPKVDNFATSHRLPTNGELKVSSATSQGGEPAQQKTQEIWHNKTLDPMTVKWMTDQGIRPPQHSSKAVTNGSGPSKSNIVSNVHRPEKVSNGYSHEVNSTSGSYTVSDGGSSSWDPSRYGPQVEPEPDVWNCWDIGAELEKRARRNQTNSLGPVTQSRSQFGPEEDIAAKVRIPTTTPTRAPIIRAYGNISAPGLGGQKGLDSYEVKSINVPRQVLPFNTRKLLVH
ncbi:hypothetical protein MMC28_005293 [Mycoblastus sanguinarius]|nr:hypothetical protein [Mycoblastus sanguinarius]